MLLPYTEAVGFSAAISQVIAFIEGHADMAKQIEAKYTTKKAYAIGDGEGVDVDKPEEAARDPWDGLV